MFMLHLPVWSMAACYIGLSAHLPVTWDSFMLTFELHPPSYYGNLATDSDDLKSWKWLGQNSSTNHFPSYQTKFSPLLIHANFDMLTDLGKQNPTQERDVCDTVLNNNNQQTVTLSTPVCLQRRDFSQNEVTRSYRPACVKKLQLFVGPRCWYPPTVFDSATSDKT
jgi:hypothetical protein